MSENIPAILNFPLKFGLICLKENFKELFLRLYSNILKSNYNKVREITFKQF